MSLIIFCAGLFQAQILDIAIISHSKGCRVESGNFAILFICEMKDSEIFRLPYGYSGVLASFGSANPLSQLLDFYFVKPIRQVAEEYVDFRNMLMWCSDGLLMTGYSIFRIDIYLFWLGLLFQLP